MLSQQNFLIEHSGLSFDLVCAFGVAIHLGVGDSLLVLPVSFFSAISAEKCSHIGEFFLSSKKSYDGDY